MYKEINGRYLFCYILIVKLIMLFVLFFLDEAKAKVEDKEK